MDLVYIPEVLTYGSFRNPQYRDYEQSWNKDYFNNGNRATINHQQFPQQHHQQKESSKEKCHLCRESKRRRLAAYIRGKSRRDSCQEIHEEEEECDTENVKEEPLFPVNSTVKADEQNLKTEIIISESCENPEKM